jgi:hypothetical protein
MKQNGEKIKLDKYLTYHSERNIIKSISQLYYSLVKFVIMFKSFKLTWVDIIVICDM